MSGREVVIVPTATANLASVLAALERLGARARLAEDAAMIEDATHVVLPGVGSFGATMTGLRAAILPAGAELELAGVRIARGRTFGDVPEGELLWYANANGLAEIAAHGASAAARLGLAPGSHVAVHPPA